MIGAEQLRRSCSPRALAGFDRELEAADDAWLDLYREMCEDERSSLLRVITFAQLEADRAEAWRRWHWACAGAGLLITLLTLREQREASALELEALHPDDVSEQGLELLAHERTDTDQTEPPPLEERSLSISPHGPPVRSAPMRTKPGRTQT